MKKDKLQVLHELIKNNLITLPEGIKLNIPEMKSDWQEYTPTSLYGSPKTRIRRFATIDPTWTGGLQPGDVISAAIEYKVGDKVRITEVFDSHYGMVGSIKRYDRDDDSYFIEFEYDGPFGPTTDTDWYYGTEEFVHANMPSQPPKFLNHTYCNHEWRCDSFFTTRVYKTCKKCGAKYEDEF